MTPRPRHITLADVNELSRPNCKIKDPERVERILNEIINGGPQQLQVITDFDYTMTKQVTNDGKSVTSSFGMLEQCESLPRSYIEESTKLTQKYRPIEINPNLCQEEKRKLMIEWWTTGAELMKGFKLDPEEIANIGTQHGHTLRDGTHDFLELTNRSSVPVLVLSAGLGDTIVSLLNHEKILYPNVKVVSNFIKYDENGFVDGLSQPLIHTFNKNEAALIGTPYYDMVHNRQHVILMGDSLADSGMAEGVPVTSSVLKIGFLFHHAEENLEIYMNTFDIVLVDDQTMDIPRKILSLAVEQPND